LEREAWVEKKALRIVRASQAADGRARNHLSWPRIRCLERCLHRPNGRYGALEETRPTTIAGVAAVLQYWLEFAEANTGMEVVGDEGDTLQFLAGLATSGQALV
jgi:hypothetical protein